MNRNSLISIILILVAVILTLTILSYIDIISAGLGGVVGYLICKYKDKLIGSRNKNGSSDGTC